jgi:hypothetical protein
MVISILIGAYTTDMLVNSLPQPPMILIIKFFIRMIISFTWTLWER